MARIARKQAALERMVEVGRAPAPKRGEYSLRLTAEIVEAFVVKYLLSKYDNPAPTPEFHRDGWALCVSDEKFVGIIAPREHAKSTAFTEAYGLASALFRQRDFLVIISNTWGQSVEFLRDMKAELTDNDQIQQDFGTIRILKDTEDDIICEMEDGYRFRIVARGSEQKIRGLKWDKKRPNLFLFDDLEDDEQVASLERRQKFAKWFDNAVIPAGSKDCLYRLSATIIHFDSLAAKLIKDDTWVCLKYKAHEGFNDFSNILWPEQFPEERLRRIQRGFTNKGNPDGYSAEYLNDPIAEGESYFRPDDLLSMQEIDYLLDKKYYAAWDFAISQRQKADYTCGVVLGVDYKGGLYVVDVRRGRWDSKQIIEEMFTVQKAWNCECHYAEAGTIEKALGPYLYDAMRRTDNYFNVEPIVPTKDKLSRASSWRAKTRAHAVKYDHNASWWPALQEEMRRFPKGEHDDQIDPQSLLGNQLENLQTPLSVAEIEEEEFRRHERQSGDNGRNTYTGY